jgi:hypothetical protein
MVLIDPLNIRFTHSRIRERFSGCNKLISETLDELRIGKITIFNIPKITVYTDGVSYYSQNNRRLYCFKILRSEGLIPSNLIDCILKPLPLHKSYTSNNCSLSAKIYFK